ncbi:MAG: carboxypeptidase-like regulatory domain-containing protein [Thermoplasmatota archaeon]
MRTYIAILVPIAFAAALGALVATQTTAQIPTMQSTLKGRICMGNLDDGVTAECDGQGLANATLRIQHSGSVGPVGAVDRSTTSDDAGVFAFAGLADGTYTLSGNHTGFLAGAITVNVTGDSSQDMTLGAKEVFAYGAVVDPSGRGVAYAYVNFCCSAATKSGPDGSFNVTVAAGEHSLDVSAPGYDAASYQVFVDGSHPLRMTLQRQPPQNADLQGTVTDQYGHAAASVVIQVSGGCCPPPSPCPPGAMCANMRPYYGGSNTTTTNGDGSYEVHVQAGTVSLSVNDARFAAYYDTVEVAAGQTVNHDISLQRFPPKTAHITGRIVDGETHAGLPGASLSVDSPAYGISECGGGGTIMYASAGQATMSASGAPQGGPGMVPQSAPPPGAPPATPMPMMPYNGCALRVAPDGTFEGNVTPGYAIVRVYLQEQCQTTQNEGGQPTQTCGPEYLPFAMTLQLPANATTALTLPMQARPGPDATLSGYLVDNATLHGIPLGEVTFSNEESYGYGMAATDGDGSYRVLLRSGYHSVTVYQNGYLHWEGTVDVHPGNNSLDILLTPGKDVGGCCFGMMKGAVAPGMAQTAPSSAPAANSATGSTAPSGGQTTFRDLHGGLGPYNAARRAQAFASMSPGKGAGGVGIALAATALVALAAVARRR